MSTRPWKPFPVHALPEPARSLVSQGADTLGCDPALVALPVLSTLAAAIGNSYVIEVRPGWDEVSVLWTAPVCESGTQKTPAQRLAVSPLQRRQDAAYAGEEVADADFLESATYLASSADGPESSPVATAPPPETWAPVHDRLVVDDITIESIAVRLRGAPHGLLLAADELSPWFRIASRGVNAARWVRVYGAGPIDIDRKTKNEWNHIPRAAVSLTGGLQPGILPELFSARAFEIGLVARLLLAHPPRRRRTWTDATISPAVSAAYDRMIGRLLELRSTRPDGRADPIRVRMRADAKRVWIEFFERHAQRQFDATGDELAMLAKVEGTAARIALVLYCAKSVGDDAANLDVLVDAESVRAGIQLAEWFADENARVYDEVRRSPAEREDAELIEWITRRGGRVRVRDVQLGLRRLRGVVAAARDALNRLVERRLGAWEKVPAGPRGGRITWDFVLATATEPPPPGSRSWDVSPPPPNIGSTPEE